MTLYGPIVTDTQIEDLLLATLRQWLSSYLGEVERNTGRDQGAIPVPVSWGIPQERFEKWPEQLTPHVAVVAGTTENLRPEGDGLYTVEYPIEVTVVVMANGPSAVESLSKAYIAAVEKVLLDQPVGDPVEDIIPLGHSPEDLGDTDRSMLAMTARFTVIATNVMQRRVGPLEPEDPDPREPSPDWPEVATVGVSTEALPLSD